MPKEVTRSGTEDHTIEVGWGAAQMSVQVGITQSDHCFQFVPEGAEPQAIDSEVYDSLWVHLTTRESVNKLIRDLRRARDQAFGKDE